MLEGFRASRRRLLLFVLAVPILVVFLHGELFGALLYETTASPLKKNELPYGEEDDLDNGKHCIRIIRKRGMLRWRSL